MTIFLRMLTDKSILCIITDIKLNLKNFVESALCPFANMFVFPSLSNDDYFSILMI